jgi:hypothetical protein
MRNPNGNWNDNGDGGVGMLRPREPRAAAEPPPPEYATAALPPVMIK